MNYEHYSVVIVCGFKVVDYKKLYEMLNPVPDLFIEPYKAIREQNPDCDLFCDINGDYIVGIQIDESNIKDYSYISKHVYKAFKEYPLDILNNILGPGMLKLICSNDALKHKENCCRNRNFPYSYEAIVRLLNKGFPFLTKFYNIQITPELTNACINLCLNISNATHYWFGNNSELQTITDLKDERDYNTKLLADWIRELALYNENDANVVEPDSSEFDTYYNNNLLKYNKILHDFNSNVDWPGFICSVFFADFNSWCPLDED